MKITSTQIRSLGANSRVFDRLGIGSIMDSRLPKSRHRKATHSNATKAMILNGLGFVGQTLFISRIL